MFNSIGHALKHWALHCGDKPAFIFRGRQGERRVLTYDQLYRLSGRWAAVLKADGRGRGSYVMDTLPNSPERLVCETATLMAGAASVNGVCQLADGSDLLQSLRQSRADAIIVDPDVTSSPWGPLQKHVRLGSDGTVTSDDLPDLKKVYFVRRREEGGDEDFLSRLETLEAWFEADDVTRDDVCTVFTTSGSTGFSKLVVHTYGNLLRTAETLGKRNEAAIDFNMAPLGWIGGHVWFNLSMSLTRVLCDVRAGGLPDDVAEFITNVVQEEKCTGANIPPALSLEILKRLKPDPQAVEEARAEVSQQEQGTRRPGGHLTWGNKLNTMPVTGQPVTRSMLQVVGVLANAALLVYASSETVINTVGFLTEKDKDTFKDYDVGSPLPGVQVRVVSRDDEESILPPGELGHIQIKSPGMFKEYLNDPEATAKAITPDGYFRTGDFGRLSEDNRLSVEGRGFDAIMRGNYIFYPAWIEERIRACPAVVDVIVVGVPDALVQEELCACVVLASDHVTLDNVREFVEKDFVSGVQDPLSPRPRHYLRFPRLPTTSTGKPDRRQMKVMATARLEISAGHVSR
nr:hypothetical protein BaRGS_023566 [Batillaria attramentaria]